MVERAKDVFADGPVEVGAGKEAAVASLEKESVDEPGKEVWVLVKEETDAEADVEAVSGADVMLKERCEPSACSDPRVGDSASDAPVPLAARRGLATGRPGRLKSVCMPRRPREFDVGPSGECSAW